MKNYPSNIRPNLVGDLPDIHPLALIDPSAQIIGNVKIGKNVFIAPLTVIRADEQGPDGTVAPIVIGEEVNIQDGVIIHSHGGESVTIGPRTSVGHGVAIHGPCSISEDCFLAMRCTLYCATVESSVWVGMGAIIIRATLSALSYVETGRIIRSRDDSRDLRYVSTNEKRYMQDVLEATNILREEYRKMRGMEIST
jgi:carbonic anhydrase/acetyltransferase-like protein (isoleucine patch superfamily)